MVRNKNSYAFNNLYVKYELFHEDSLIKTDLTEVILFEPKTGKPLGTGMGSTFDRILILSNRILSKFLGITV